MKVSVITLHSSINYGSVLQTYATQTVLKSVGAEAEFVDYYRPNNTEHHRVREVMSSGGYKKLHDMSLGLADPVLRQIARKRINRRLIPLKKFLKQYCTLTENAYYSIKELQSNPPMADVYMTGSDQVWNTDWNGKIDRAYFLEYAPEGKKRIAYSASIGKTELNDKEKVAFRQMLKKYDSISMREQSGVEVLESLGIDSVQVLDPTLMLNRDEWCKLAVEAPVKKPFLLVYQLNHNPEMRAYTEKMAAKLGLELVNIKKAKERQLRAKPGITDIVAPDVGQFIWLFRNAKYVITDSFHATAFSLNFHTPFLIILPKLFSTRLESITALTHTGNRILTDLTDTKTIQKPIDWEYADSVLQKEREKSLDFLRQALK
ncbi:MAG: polysaccharide pyruvyl transferase family protein [Oscillospiraceae bacterium]|nr:polysaccharide pyruvyl transferase family protein [Oscillospiraceae bacterium]